MIASIATALVVLVALAGTRFVAPGITPWHRFWAIAFFALLVWPIAITLAGRFAGQRAALALSFLAVSLSVAQQLGPGALPLPLVVRWSVSLVSPGDAIRREITLPPATDPAWDRAWSRAARAAIAICTEERVAEGASIAVTMNDGQAVPLASLLRTGPPDSVGGYELPVSRAAVDARRPLVVDVRRGAGGGAPARVCGGQDDPTRPGWTGSARLTPGGWISDQLADLPIPPIAGRPAPSRYYIELRLYDADGRPHAGIWY